ncbi:hypothetical protein, partial [Staphylococcus hominis]|uniref:hypothetical protein n=1 Tax=Staphylococcus hominis TaxID=1290 RepID=UPI001E37FF59
AENNQKNYKKDNFYIISIEIVFFHLFRNFMSQTHIFCGRKNMKKSNVILIICLVFILVGCSKRK